MSDYRELIRESEEKLARRLLDRRKIIHRILTGRDCEGFRDSLYALNREIHSLDVELIGYRAKVRNQQSGKEETQ